GLHRTVEKQDKKFLLGLKYPLNTDSLLRCPKVTERAKKNLLKTLDDPEVHSSVQNLGNTVVDGAMEKLGQEKYQQEISKIVHSVIEPIIRREKMKIYTELAVFGATVGCVKMIRKGNILSRFQGLRKLFKDAV
ncbi:hypothetical protein FRX31_003355, partial [Thalictrum thalictroides]